MSPIELPKVIIHNSISIDGSLTDFEPDLGLHYRIAGGYRPGAHLIGSNTVRAGIELYGEGIPKEEEGDFHRPERQSSLPYWAIIDSKGALKGMLHTCRRFEYCRDVIVFVSETTPSEYIEHLREREYDCHLVGKGHVDLEKALRLLRSRYRIRRILTDTGRVLGNMLMEQGLASELSLLVHPVIVGEKSYGIFGNIRKSMTLRLVKKEFLPKGILWLVYRVGARVKP